MDLAGWFSSTDRLVNVAIGAVVFFVAIVVLVRLLGNRTTGQMNNFDWIITVAVGSLAASGILLERVAVTDALLAIAVLAALQWLTTWWVLRSKHFAHLVKSRPTLLTHKGKFLRDAMKRTRISEEEINTALRQEGMTSVEDCAWVILETNGTMSVIPRGDREFSDCKVLSNVIAPDRLQ